MDAFEDLGVKFLQGFQNHVDEHGAALDVIRPGTVDAVSFRTPVEVVELFFLGREDGVEVGDQGEGGAGADRWGGGLAAEEEVAAEPGVGRLDEFGLESEAGEGLGGQFCQHVDAGGIGGEAVDGDHAVQEVEVCGEAVGEVFVQFFHGD